MNKSSHATLIALDLLDQTRKVDKTLRHFLDGDVLQMAEQKAFLISRGLRIGVSEGKPGFDNEADYKKALKFIWGDRFDGWWNYRVAFEQYKICTTDEFQAAIERTTGSD